MPVRNFAVIARKPRLSDLFVETMIGINGGQVSRTPGTRVKDGRH
jgi:hypothetical protein